MTSGAYIHASQHGQPSTWDDPVHPPAQHLRPPAVVPTFAGLPPALLKQLQVGRDLLRGRLPDPYPTYSFPPTDPSWWGPPGVPPPYYLPGPQTSFSEPHYPPPQRQVFHGTCKQRTNAHGPGLSTGYTSDPERATGPLGHPWQQQQQPSEPQVQEQATGHQRLQPVPATVTNVVPIQPTHEKDTSARLPASAPQPQPRQGVPESHQELLYEPIRDGLAALQIPSTAQLPSNSSSHSRTELFPAAHVQALADPPRPVTRAVARARQQGTAEESHHDISTRRLSWPGDAPGSAPQAPSLLSALSRGLSAGFPEAYPSLHLNSQPTHSAELLLETRLGMSSSAPSGWTDRPYTLGQPDNMAGQQDTWGQESQDAGVVSGFLNLLASEQHTPLVLPAPDADQPIFDFAAQSGSALPCLAHSQRPSPSAWPTHTSQAGQGAPTSAPVLPMSKPCSWGDQELALDLSMPGSLGPPVRAHPAFNPWAGDLPESLPLPPGAPHPVLPPGPAIRPMVSAQPPSRKRPSSVLSPAVDATVQVGPECGQCLSNGKVSDTLLCFWQS